MAEFLADAYKRLVRMITSGGLIGGISSLVFGFLLFFLNLRLWRLSKDVGFGVLLDDCQKKEATFVALLLVAVGVGIVFDRSSFRLGRLLGRISKAERKGHIAPESGNAARTILLWQILGEKIDLVDFAFREFLTWIKGTKSLKTDMIDKLDQLWKTYRNRRVP